MVSWHLRISTYDSDLFVGDGFDEVMHISDQLPNEQEFHKVQELCESNHNMAGVWKWSFIPIRTNNLSDLLFPTLINGAIASEITQSGLEKRWKGLFALAALVALVWDIATLPIRAVTYFLRLCCNYFIQDTPHPLIAYLKEKQIIDFASEGSERVNVDLYTEVAEDTHITRKVMRYGLTLSKVEIPFLKFRSEFSGTFS